ncbi:MAG: DMT family transporter [Rhizobiales bacterium]|nr:DMT family transporter [Hyphomicrobiales bacterium]
MPEMKAAPLAGPDRIMAGIGLMLAAMFAFSINDVMGKWLVATYGVAQLLLIRSFAAALMLAPAIHRTGWRTIVFQERPWLHVARAICSTAEVAFFYWAVIYLPLADAVAFYLACPIFVTLFAIVFLKEKVGWRRWLAIVVGFIGVLIAVNPTGAGIGWPALIAISGTILFAGLNILTRKLAGANEVALVTWQVASALLFGLVVAPFRWVQPSLFDFACLSLLGIVATLAHMGVNRSLKYAPAAVVVPYQYTLIVWAVVLGFLFFGDVPKLHVLIGSAVIVAAGLYIFMREQARAREKVS